MINHHAGRSDQYFTLGIFSRKVPTYPEDLTEERRKEKDDLEEDDVDDDDSEGGIGTYL